MFLSQNCLFSDTASVHTHSANSAANPDIFKSTLQEPWLQDVNPNTIGDVTGEFDLNTLRVDGKISLPWKERVADSKIFRIRVDGTIVRMNQPSLLFTE